MKSQTDEQLTCNPTRGAIKRTRLARLRSPLVALLTVLPMAGGHAETTVFATDLVAPTKIDATRHGSLLVSESGTGARDGRLSIVDRHGIARPLMDGLPSGLAATGDPSGPTAVLLRGCCVVELAIGEGDTLIFGDAGGEVPNPAGPSSPLFSSLLRMHFPSPVDQLAGGFILSQEDHETLADGFKVVLQGPGGGETAIVELVTDLKDLRPDPIIGVRASNPFAIVGNGKERLIVDAAQNGIVQIARDGPPKTLLRFGPVPNPLPFGPPLADAVPTSIQHLKGDKFLVTLLVGFPFAPGTSSVRLFDLGKRDEKELISGLTSPTDALRIQGDLYVLELTGNLLEGTPGRLLRFDTPSSSPEVVAPELIGPTGMVHVRQQKAIFIVENFAGRIVRVAL